MTTCQMLGLSGNQKQQPKMGENCFRTPTLTFLLCLLSAEKVPPIVSAHTQTAHARTHARTHPHDKQTRAAQRLKKLPARIAEWKDINI